MNRAIEILVADDHTLFRKGLINLLNASPDFKVTAEAANGIEVVEQVASGNLFDVLLLDVNMPVMNGLETVERLKARGKSYNVLMVSMEENELTILKLIRLGIKGYILKDAEPSELKKALKTVAGGNYYYNQKVTERMVRKAEDRNWEEREVLHTLTPREIEFLQHLASDLSHAQIAEKMGISHRTVHGYMADISGKIGLKGRVALALYAARNGFV